MASDENRSIAAIRRSRHWTIFVAIPAFILNLVHGIIWQKPFPALGLIASGFSFLVGIWALASFRWPRHDYQYKILLTEEPPKKGNSWKEVLIMLADFLLANLFLAFFILGVIFGTARAWRGGGMAAYATMPYLVSCYLHGRIFALEVYLLMKNRAKPSRPEICPHCHESLLATPPPGNSSRQGKTAVTAVPAVAQSEPGDSV